MTTPSVKDIKTSPSRQPYFYHLESASLSNLGGRAEKFLTAFAEILIAIIAS